MLNVVLVSPVYHKYHISLSLFHELTVRAPTDCVQYFTGIADTVQNYNYGNQMLQNQN